LTDEKPTSLVLAYESKTDLAAALLRELILTGELAPGQPLRQRTLAERLGVSPTPIREALRRLEAEGLVTTDVHRGAAVAKPDFSVAEENARVRGALEALAAELAADKISEAELDDLRALNRAMAESLGDRHHYATLNRQFHFDICRAAHSPLLLSLLRLLWQSMPEGPIVSRPLDRSVNQHAELLDALAAHDGKRAAKLVHEHIEGSPHLATERAAQTNEARPKGRRAAGGRRPGSR